MGGDVVTDRDGRALQRRVREFVRRFGLLGQDRRRCGRPLPTWQAHPFQVLGPEGPTRQRTLAARFRLEESTVCRLPDQLVERGWVDKRVKGANRRATLLALTERGREMLAAITAASDRKFAAIIARIPTSEHAKVLAALDAPIAASEEERRNG
jgi:DNA-binding MarR family transcriptional regulator